MNRAQRIASALIRLSELVGNPGPAAVGVADASTKAALNKWQKGVCAYNKSGGLAHLNRLLVEQGRPPLGQGAKLPAAYFKATDHPTVIEAFGALAARSTKAWSGLVSTDASNLVVIDIDVRSDRDGNASLRDFEERNRISFPPSLSASTPTGGRHIVYRQPSQLIGVRPIKSIIGFLPGVDIKAKGGYVLAPTDGSDGRIWIDDAYAVAELPIEFAALFADKGAKPAPIASCTTSTPRILKAEDAYFDNAGLARQLAKVDPRNYRDHALWFRFMCSCHDVTAGMGLNAFLDWCARDTVYPAHLHASKIAARWNSLGRGGLHG